MVHNRKNGFFISPAYLVPPINTIPLDSEITTKTSELTPYSFGSTVIVGACSIVNSGTWVERESR